MLDQLDEFDERFDLASEPLARSAKKPSLAVDILSVATATPEHKFSQVEALSRVNRVTSVFARLSGIYTNSGIETRYSCVPPPSGRPRRPAPRLRRRAPSPPRKAA
jgi:hypothetical protein